MKKYFSIAVLLVIFLTTSAFAVNPVKNQKISKETVESLLQGLESENYGLKLSSAYMLGELSSDKAMFKLMRMLRTSENEDERIVAALALYKIGDPVGMNIVKKAVMFDNSERVKKHCSDFYNQYVKNSHKELKNYYAAK